MQQPQHVEKLYPERLRIRHLAQGFVAVLRDELARPPEALVGSIKFECRKLLELRSRTNENFEQRFEFKLFNKLPSGRDSIRFQDLVYNKEYEFNEQILNMAKIFVDGINESDLVRNMPQAESGKSICNMLRFLVKAGLEPDEAEKIAAGFRMIQSLRSTAAAHLRGENYERDLRRFDLERRDPKDKFDMVATRFQFLLEKLDNWLTSSS